MASKKKHMNEFLKEVFKHFIAIKDADYKRAQNVFNCVFELVKQKMCEQDNFFNKYASQVLNAGSVYDGIKVGKLDEFDMDIVIRLPISYEDCDNGIIIENHKPGFVKMKITNPFDNMDKQPDWEKCHKVTREWRDKDKYFLQSRFRQWMHGIVQRAVSELGGQVTVEGVPYLLTFREAGPAFTLSVRHAAGALALHVGLVPVVRFLLPRWPQGYRKIPDSPVKEWLVVPKPLKTECSPTDQARCWRLAFHDFERDIIKGCEQLKPIIRLMKKLRDSLEMKAIASYYIKTLFLWEVEARGKKYWQNKTSVLLLHMVQRLDEALDAGKIRYFWHEGHNLLHAIRPSLLAVYRTKLNGFLRALINDDAETVCKYLLTPEEFQQFTTTDFYKSFPSSPAPTVENPVLSRQASVSSANGKAKEDSTTNDLVKELITANKRLESKFESLIKKMENKLNGLTERVDSLSDQLEIVKMHVKKTDERLDAITVKNEKSCEEDKGFGEMVLNVLSNIKTDVTNCKL